MAKTKEEKREDRIAAKRRRLTESHNSSSQANAKSNGGAAYGSSGASDGRGTSGRRSSGGRRTSGGGTVKMGKLKKAGIIAAIFLVLIIVLRISAYVSSTSKIHLTDDGLKHNKRFNDCIIVHGIDVSEYQDEINWKKVKSSEADFVFVRAGYRSAKEGDLHEDADYKSNMKKAAKAGIMVGAYFYSQALTEKEAVEEAEFLINLVKRYDVTMPLAIDYEFYKDGRLAKKVADGEMPASSMYHDIVQAFCRTVEEAGYESIVYANYDMLTNYMDSTLLDDETNIWAAQYGESCDVKGDYRIWQCAEDASIDGIEGNVDHDIWYITPGMLYATKAAGKKNQTTIESCEIKFDSETCKLKNHRAEPKVTVTYEGKKLRSGKDYELSFIKNTTAGTGYALVRGINKYKDWTSVPFTIE